MYDLQDLLQYNKCIFKEEEKTGKVLALSTSGVHQQVCFLFEGDKLGTWIETSSIVGLEAQQYKNSALQGVVEGEIEQEAEEDVNALVLFLNKNWKKIKDKANKDIGQTQKFLEMGAKAFGDLNTAVDNFLDCTSKKIGSLVVPLTKTITKLWKEAWLERIVSAITGLDLKSAYDKVKSYKKNHPHESNEQVAQFFTDDKVYWSIFFGIVADVPAVGIAIDLFRVTPLLVEMIYQVGVSYGVEEFDNGEILGILGLSFGAGQLHQLGIGFLAKNAPAPAALINITTNVLIFLSVGYVACEYYEQKSQGEENPLVDPVGFNVLEQKVKIFLNKAKVKIEAKEEEILEKALAIKVEVQA